MVHVTWGFEPCLCNCGPCAFCTVPRVYGVVLIIPACLWSSCEPHGAQGVWCHLVTATIGSMMTASAVAEYLLHARLSSTDLHRGLIWPHAPFEAGATRILFSHTGLEARTGKWQSQDAYRCARLQSLQPGRYTLAVTPCCLCVQGAMFSRDTELNKTQEPPWRNSRLLRDTGATYGNYKYI